MTLSEVEKQRAIWRKASKKYKENHKEKVKDYIKEVGNKYFADATRKYTHGNKDKEKAKRVYHKDKTKQLVRANTYNSNEKTGICFDCKKKTKTEFHHLFYVPNFFIEVCKKCHNKRHGRKTWVA